jgi:hypothetical protein
MSISVRRVVLSGLIAGPIEIVLKIIEGGLYLNSLFTDAIQRVNPALLEGAFGPSGLIGFILITLLLGVFHMYIYAAMRPRFDSRLAAVASAATAAGTVEALNWALVGLIGIFTWWHICVEATMTLGNMFVAVYAGSLVYKDARPLQLRG